MAAFLGILFVALAWLGHLVLWVGAVNRLHANCWPRKLVDLATLGCGLMLPLLGWPLLAVTQRYLPLEASLGDWVPSAGPLATAYAAGCAVLAVVAIAARLYYAFHAELTGVLQSSHSSEIPLGDHSADSLLAPGLPRLLGRLPGNQVLAPQLIKKELALPQLPPSFAGLRIAHLSDLHLSGRIARDYFDAIVDETNRLAPDLVVLTGDIVERKKCLDWVDESLARLDPQVPRLFVLGNHDRKAGPDEVRRRLTNAGFVDVAGGCTEITLPHGQCLVAGNEAPWFAPVPQLPWGGDTLSGTGVLRLALVHTPDLFGWCAGQQFHLALAGHNHGGQIRLPLLGAIVAPSLYGTRYASGVFRRGPTVMHVSQGTSCLAPLRFNCPPELALLTLVPGE
jgi:predicted MPP superfamily phosphohydrolase